MRVLLSKLVVGGAAALGGVTRLTVLFVYQGFISDYYV
jgi:hypothetical protein